MLLLHFIIQSSLSFPSQHLIAKNSYFLSVSDLSAKATFAVYVPNFAASQRMLGMTSASASDPSFFKVSIDL